MVVYSMSLKLLDATFLYMARETTCTYPIVIVKYPYITWLGVGLAESSIAPQIS